MTHSNTNPRSGQYLTDSHSHITRAVAAMDSCFGLVRPHQVPGQTAGWCVSVSLAFIVVLNFIKLRSWNGKLTTILLSSSTQPLNCLQINAWSGLAKKLSFTREHLYRHWVNDSLLRSRFFGMSRNAPSHKTAAEETTGEWWIIIMQTYHKNSFSLAIVA